MRFTFENDHVRNLANFDSLIAKIVEDGEYYKPSKRGIQLEALLIVSQNARLAIANVNLFTNQYIHSTNIRKVTFESLKIINQEICQSLQSTSNISETEMHMLVGAAKKVGKPLSSQHYYDFLLENFFKVIKMLKDHPFYSPQKSALKVNKLEDFYATLYLKNNEVKQNHHLLNHAHFILSEVLYREHYGLVPLATTVKMYIKYHYGWDSEYYKYMAALLIKKAK